MSLGLFLDLSMQGLLLAGVGYASGYTRTGGWAVGWDVSEAPGPQTSFWILLYLLTSGEAIHAMRVGAHDDFEH